MSSLVSRLRTAWARRLGAAATGLALAAGALAPALAASPASAAVDAPGNFTGLAFDTCTAPTQAQMDAWWVSSPFGAVGIYISGSSRACTQAQLTKTWVSTQAGRGWRFLPIHVGMQAPCYGGNKQKMSTNPTTARAQGVAAANESVTAAKTLGIGSGRVLYLDIEWYAISNTTCNSAVVSFIDGWGSRIAQLGYRSGLYSSASAAIAAMNQLRDAQVGGYHYPNHLWFAWYNGKANLAAEPYLDDRYWVDGKRIHQYVGNRLSRYNGVTINIDLNYMDVGAGSRPTKPKAQCGTQDVTKYRTVRPGQRRPTLAPASKCLLRQRGYFSGKTTSPVHGAKAQRAVKRFQAAHGWAQTGVISRRVWVALLSDGSAPVLKRGSTGKYVYRLQRSLTAALGRSVPRNGLFDATTERAVLDYRKKVKLPAWRTAEPRLWASLRAGKY
ncbi:glycoside hydrolase domain-containing protein [Mumia sp. DW29H23]|uniref:glycoside hydrolase domain-containing protein n=1 Tax=Mumia sp. DW29H23 TaxID=3421241 RepID=UPI003D697220